MKTARTKPMVCYYQGPGRDAWLFRATNFRAHYDLTKHLQLVAQIDNLFNRKYYTAAQLADTGFTAQGAVTTRPYSAYATGPQAGNYPAQAVTFFAPGAPRRAWAELRFRF